ncbi:hypothetical protein [Streptomyces sp. 1222.5]|uniref:hypothetical protein n=1 Tax=Streptomyces sp. 1222.5 TaxID=1881026 RepID=UPI003EBED517
MNDRAYTAERIERYTTALREADTYAQLERQDDRERFARAVMAVADAETDPVYRSGYQTGHMHAGSDNATGGAGPMACETKPSGEASTDFFRAGRTYAYDASGFTAPECLTLFRVVAETTHPDTGQRVAFGWIRTAEDVAWSPYVEPAEEWPASWTEIPEGGEVQ